MNKPIPISVINYDEYIKYVFNNTVAIFSLEDAIFVFSHAFPGTVWGIRAKDNKAIILRSIAEADEFFKKGNKGGIDMDKEVNEKKVDRYEGGTFPRNDDGSPKFDIDVNEKKVPEKEIKLTDGKEVVKMKVQDKWIIETDGTPFGTTILQNGKKVGNIQRVEFVADVSGEVRLNFMKYKKGESSSNDSLKIKASEAITEAYFIFNKTEQSDMKEIGGKE